MTDQPALTREPFDELNESALRFMKQIERAWLFASEVFRATGVVMEPARSEDDDYPDAVCLDLWHKRPNGVNTCIVSIEFVPENEPSVGAFIDGTHFTGHGCDSNTPYADALRRVKAALRDAKKSATT